MTEKDPDLLSLDEIERIEKLTLRWIFQAVNDFGIEAHEIFRKSPDNVKDIAEDITRELLDRLSGFNVQQRVYGTVDYNKERYVILTDQTIRQALFIDSKAEKENRSATIQMSQTSLRIKQRRTGIETDEEGFLPEISKFAGKNYLTTTCLIHFMYYDDIDKTHHLKEVTIAAIPNGKLQGIYNPDVDDGIWLAGRNAPSLGEDFRVRVSFSRLKNKAPWRVQTLMYNQDKQICEGLWQS